MAESSAEVFSLLTGEPQSTADFVYMNKEIKYIRKDLKKIFTEKLELIGGIFVPPGKSKNFPSKKDQIDDLNKDSAKKDQVNKIDVLTKKSDWIISISPDGENILTFNIKTLEFRIVNGKDIDKVRETNSYNVKDEFKSKTAYNSSKWMVAISNCVTPQKDVFVAISCIKKFDMTNPDTDMTKSNMTKSDMIKSDNQKNETRDRDISVDDDKIRCENFTVEIDHESGDKHGQTVIFRINLTSFSQEKQEYIYIYKEVGGIVVFVHNKSTIEMKKEETIRKTYCFVFNVNGIYRCTLDNHGLKDHDLFDYPKRLQYELETLYKNKSCMERLNDCIFDHYFFIEQYNEGTQVLQLYNLMTMKLEQIFNTYEGKSIKKFGDPIFARSNNQRIIAFSPGFRKVSLFLKGNGLEIASKDFELFLKENYASENFGNVKILFCDFINDDETLIVIIKKPGCKTGKVLFWNLFNTKDKIKIGKDISFEKVKENINYINFEKYEENTSSIARIPGKLITINSDGVISSVVFDRLIDETEERGLELHSIIIHNTCKDKEGTPNKMPQSDAKAKKDVNHKIYHRKDSHQEKTKPVVKNKEPWLTDNYERISVYLDKEENTQLFIGRSTVQVWRKDEVSGKKFLEYIWTNNVGMDHEEYKLNILELYVGERCFYLKVRWRELNDGEFVEVKWPYEDNHVTPIKHACDALEHFNYRRNKLIGYAKQHEFEDMKDRINYIIWRFIKHEPDIWRLMDARFDVMAKIIIGGSNTLVKYILFGDGNRNLHVPRLPLHRWEDKEEYNLKEHYRKARGERMNIKILSDLQIAIRLCKGGLEGNRRTLIVAYLLEYYTKYSLNQVGWLITVSEALPDLYEYKLENYVKVLFYKRCISGLEISNIIEYTDFTPKEIQITFKASPKFRAFNPISKLISKNKKRNSISLFLARLYLKIFPNLKDPSPIVKMVPLYNFTVSKIPQKQRKIQDEYQDSTLIKIFKLIFIPRGYYVDDKKKDDPNSSQLSPLVQIIRAEKDDDIFDNPAMEAVIYYKWGPARNYFLRVFFMYILYAACFATLGGSYVGHVETTGHLRNFFVFLFVVFYYLGVYLFLVECRQFQHHNWRHYLEFFNFIDLASIVTSLVIMSAYINTSFKLSNGFADAQTTQDLTAAISFTMLLLWFEFLLYLRLLSEPAKYLYIILYIIQRTYIFVIFMLLIVLALSHAFLILLQHPDFTNLTPKASTSTLSSPKGEIIGKITDDFDPIRDNPSKNFITSFRSTYDWLRGSYAQDDKWDFWAVQALTLIASLFSITIVQNIYIAFLWGVYAEAYENGRIALLRFRAELISDYEALDEIYFSPPPSEPKYIYYVGKYKGYDAWKKIVKKREKDKVKFYDDYEGKMNEAELSFEEIEDEKSFWNYRQ